MTTTSPELPDVGWLATILHREHIGCDWRTVDENGSPYGRGYQVETRCFAVHDEHAAAIVKATAAPVPALLALIDQHDEDARNGACDDLGPKARAILGRSDG